MHLPTLPLSSNTYIYTEGDVSIDPSAMIAAGAILRADPNSQIRIAAGVCIGAGSILHAQGGTLEIEAGANLGAGVLVVGKGKIGTNACIGAITTIWNNSIDPWQVVPSGSLLGDKGRQIPEDSSASTASPSSNTPDTTVASISTIEQESPNGQVPSSAMAVSTDTTEPEVSTEPATESASSDDRPSVYGQGNLNRLLKTLFPYTNPSVNIPQDEDG
jgi:carbon dioxide concentrating mechanism protein CcmN